MSFSNQFSITINPVATTPLGTAAAALLAGGNGPCTDMTPNQHNQTYDITWQPTNGYYDATRREIQYMGKAQNGGQPRHYIYDEVDNSWSSIEANPIAANTYTSIGDGRYLWYEAVVGNPVGHIWNSAFDPATGDYYTVQMGYGKILKFNRATSTWGVAANIPTPYVGGSNGPNGTPHNGEGTWPGMGWHPNLFGSGDGGIVMRGDRGMFAWQASSPYPGTFATLSPSDSFDKVAGGDYVYFSGQDAIIIGTGWPDATTTKPIMRVNAGSGGSVTSATYVGEAPVDVAGRPETSPTAKMVLHPSDPTKAIIMEEKTSTYYVSTDYGATWPSAGSHPFNSVLGNRWSCVSIPEHNVILGYRSATSGGGNSFQWHLWKPA